LVAEGLSSFFFDRRHKGFCVKAQVFSVFAPDTEASAVMFVGLNPVFLPPSFFFSVTASVVLSLLEPVSEVAFFPS